MGFKRPRLGLQGLDFGRRRNHSLKDISSPVTPSASVTLDDGFQGNCELIDSLDDNEFSTLIAAELNEFCDFEEAKKIIPDPSDPKSIFFSPFRQRFSLQAYVHRLLKYTDCSRSIFIAALVYLDRVQYHAPSLQLNHLNVHRLLTTAVTLSVKFHDDEVYRNEHYARVGGIPSVQEMNQLEVTMLEILDYRLLVAVETFQEYLTSFLRRRIGQRCLQLPDAIHRQVEAVQTR